MIIEEFISTYAEQELNKINKINQRAEEEALADDDVDSLDLTPASRGGSSKIIFNLILQGELQVEGL